ncbi:5-amino-6-(5-phospho-D-ribitylamino)uracil phosphatase YigB [Rosenbergiella australiborealis]|uniref:5-amino-6-(5-phospho-D-ribitylamino)uracil phosphatase YigB n=1 Tax=Rosenbergiella australiborealis TaxID=1544696 RepID=A0ABS5T5B7_9GAMM|nr:5-amino-6-(5-phospho-D-ribitylamino)uracil phosphatase YigB [Rosenbergiella australiborealis]MBT0727537.1 5-amino-6-(5-phospho-D-ribitylamino)uracil phosphatase YigB [Rosenbergiella australiborealis]
MRFYRPLHRPQAITFDLDDTLYDNRQVILTTVEKTHQALQAWHPRLAHVTHDDYNRVRLTLEQHHPTIIHDMTAWRYATLVQLMQNVGLSDVDAKRGAEQVMAVFHQWRSAVEIPCMTHQVLAELSAKVPLVAITNGNADASQLGIAQYFALILRAGPDGRAKPSADLYQIAANTLNMHPAKILHVGDDLITDIQGALVAGYQACWINDRQQDLLTARSARLVPHLEISRLDSLTSLL